MIQQFFVDLGPWSWIILGLVLLVLEIVAPGTMMLWFGLAAVAVGLISFAMELGWQTQFILFAVLSLVSVIIGRMMLSQNQNASTDRPLLNDRMQALVGQDFQLGDAIENGQGRVKINDTYWRVTGPDCPAGSKIRIVAAEGSQLRVEPIASNEG